MSDNDFRIREEYSVGRITELRSRMESNSEISRLDDLCIYATGSLGRGDAWRESDLDVFFIRPGNAPAASAKPKPLDKARVLAAIENIRGTMHLPELTERFLDFHYIEDILASMGSAEEDARNMFTARMLMLLEGTYLYNSMAYQANLGKIVGEYFRDYENNQEDFRPIYLINDIIRFWKTMCLNYEKKRNDVHAGNVDGRFKLKYSRLLTCFSMIAPLVSEQAGVITKEVVVDLSNLKPWERLTQAATVSADGVRILKELRTEYAWFLRETATKARLERALDDKARKHMMFDRANQFNRLMYEFLMAVTINNQDMRRYLAL